MTHNQVAYKEAQTKVNEAEEQARHNKQSEKTETGKAISQGVASNVGAIGQLIRGAASLVGAINDPSWYNKDENLVKDVASFSFATPLGGAKDNKLKRVEATSTGTISDGTSYDQYVPGVCVLKYINTIPKPELMKTISDKYYAFVRHANSGSRNYESNDLTMYLLAVSDAYASIAHACLVYSILRTYKNQNYYYARGYLRAMGYSDILIDSMINNLSQFRGRINRAIRRVNSFNIPNTFPLFKRKVWMNCNIFKDHEIKRSSNYVFCPEGVAYYHEDGDGSWLTIQVINGATTYSSFMDFIDNAISALFNSEDLGIMSGDILKAYTDKGIVQFNEIEEDFHVEETYSAEVLSQINSATLVGKPKLATGTIFTATPTGSYSNIYQGARNVENPGNHPLETYRAFDKQGPNTLLFRTQQYGWNKFVMDNSLWQDIDGREHTVNMYKDDVTPDDVMVATRLQADYKIGLKVTEAGTGAIRFDRFVSNCGSEVLTTASFCVRDENNPSNFTIVGEIFDGIAVDDGNLNEFQLFDLPPFARIISNFDWAPRIRYILGTQAKYKDFENHNLGVKDLGLVILYDNMDRANYMNLSSENLAALHAVALMSEFDV